MGKSGCLKRIEPDEPKRVESDPEVSQWLVKTGWETLFFRFQGSNYQVSHPFVESFNGQVAKVGDLTINVSEEFIAQAKGFPCDGDH